MSRFRPAPTKASRDVALMQLLSFREDLDAIDTVSLARSYGKKPAEIEALVAAEKRRRLNSPV